MHTKGIDGPEADQIKYKHRVSLTASARTKRDGATTSVIKPFRYADWNLVTRVVASFSFLTNPEFPSAAKAQI